MVCSFEDFVVVGDNRKRKARVMKYESSLAVVSNPAGFCVRKNRRCERCRYYLVLISPKQVSQVHIPEPTPYDLTFPQHQFSGKHPELVRTSCPVLLCLPRSSRVQNVSMTPSPAPYSHLTR